MPIRSCFLLLLTLYVMSTSSACREKGKYAVTVYFTSYDSSRSRAVDCPEKLGKKFMSSYEEFNTDSNLVYGEYYTAQDPRHGSCDYWRSKPWQICQTTWRGKEKLSTKVDYFPKFTRNWSPADLHKQYSYQYRDGLMVRCLLKDQTVPDEEDDYDDHKQMIQKRVYDGKTLWITTRYFYNNAGKETAETLSYYGKPYTRDTFLYDKNDRLIQRQRFDTKGKLVGDRQIIRDSAGRRVIEKGNEDPDWAGWHEETRYYYDQAGYIIKEDYYIEDKLKVKFELRTGPPGN